MTIRIKCQRCDNQILEVTARKNNGLCAICICDQKRADINSLVQGRIDNPETLQGKYARIETDLSALPVQVYSLTSDELGTDAVAYLHLASLSHAYAKVSKSKGRRYIDCLFSIGGDWIVSQRFVDAIAGFKTVAGVRFVPVTLTGAKQPIPYFAVAATRIDALDRDRSQIDYYRSVPDSIKQINQLVLNPSVLQDLEWLITNEGDFIVSDSVMASFQRHELVGLQYLPVGV